jgi:ferric-dicitrate binding protein FerR (iron transport regulator)
MVMNEDRLKVLQEKYYAGETSVAEERELQELLRQDGSETPESVILKVMEYNRMLELSPDFENKLQQAILESSENSSSHRVFWKWVGGIAASVLVVSILYFLNIKFASGGERIVLTETSRSKVALPDGSLIWLNKNSELHYPEKFAQDKRQVRLKGEAFFEVAANPKSPFSIITENSVTEVLGTSFNLRSYEAEAEVVVTVVSGKVSFSAFKEKKTETIFLIKNETANLNKQHNVIAKIERNDLNATAWKTRKLTFDDDLISKVIDDLERYYDTEIQTKDSNLTDCHFRGSFQDAPLEEVLKAISFSLDITFRQVGKKYILEGKGCTTDNSTGK